jgi:ATP-dependent protease ClpP protease subunit/DNA-binding ferritin-like protein
VSRNTITIYEEIYSYSATNIVYQIQELERQYDTIKVRINSPGGDVFASYSIFRALLDSPARIEVYIDGLAASCASWIALAADKVYMADYALIMWHDPFYPGYTELDEKQQNSLEAFKNSMRTIYSKRTGKSMDEVAGLMEKETWFDASQALEAGIIDEIIITERKAPANILAISNNVNGAAIKQLHNSFSELITKDNMNIKEVANALNVPEDKVPEAVKNMVAENSTLKAQNMALETANETLTGRAEDAENKVQEFEAAEKQRTESRADAVINQAVKDRKFAASAKAEWKTIFLANPEAAEKAINSLPVNPKLSDLPEDGGQQQEKKVSAWEAAKNEVITK